MAGFIQININLAAVAQAELSVKIANSKLDIALLREPVTYKNKLIQMLPCFEGFPSQTLSTRSRAAIYEKRNLELIELVSLQTADCAVALCRIYGVQRVVSCYLNINNKEVITP